MLPVVLYLESVIAANLFIMAFGAPAVIWSALFLDGLLLTLRDRLHDQWRGRFLWVRILFLLSSAAAIEVVLKASLGWQSYQCLPFVVAGLADSVIYARLCRRSWYVRSTVSNLGGAMADLGLALLVFGAPAFGALGGLALARVAGGFLWAFWFARGRLVDNPIDRVSRICDGSDLVGRRLGSGG